MIKYREGYMIYIAITLIVVLNHVSLLTCVTDDRIQGRLYDLLCDHFDCGSKPCGFVDLSH